jgi:hypothetical protein
MLHCLGTLHVIIALGVVFITSEKIFVVESDTEDLLESRFSPF